MSTILFSLLLTAPIYGQVETPEEASEEGSEESAGVPDTIKVNIGTREVIIIDHGEEDEYDLEFGEDGEEACRQNQSEAHWSGVDFGFTMLMNDAFEPKFADHPYWENDPARSQVWNLNLLEHKFNIAGAYFGVTTGLGFSFTSVAFKDDYLLRSSADSLYAIVDTLVSYSKNKLKASYLTIPLLLEFNTNADADKSFYLATGVVGGVRLTSKMKRKGEFEGKEFVQKEKGTYSLNAFKLDGVVRLGYGSWGAFGG
ncbi:MAG: outer membrane beta-barrel protein [Crocinitomicaceae bacterium]|nr:outer membrane beta-barrel protein [Crocinitomicaceae bacterium]